MFPQNADKNDVKTSNDHEPCRGTAAWLIADSVINRVLTFVTLLSDFSEIVGIFASRGIGVNHQKNLPTSIFERAFKTQICVLHTPQHGYKSSCFEGSSIQRGDAVLQVLDSLEQARTSDDNQTKH